MYKIGTFSKITFLSVKTLRYYDEINLLTPARVDDETGYRYYDDENFQKAVIIKSLRRFDFSIKELLEIVPKIENWDDLSDYLIEKHEQLEAQIHAIKRNQNAIIKEVVYMKEVVKMTRHVEVEVIDVPEIRVATIRYKGKYEDVGIYIGKLFKAAGMHVNGTPFSLYYDEEYTDELADIEVALPVKKDIHKDGIETRVLPPIKCVKYIHVGSYDRISNAYKVVADYINENQLETYTPSREIYLKGPGMLLKGNPDKYETEILIPIK